MLAIKKARKIILTNPDHPGAKVLASLVIALETSHPFPLSQLYTLDFEQFELALEVLAEWRLDRYYSSKGRLLDLSLQAAEIQSA
jgi:hypothetical protein